APVRVLVPAPPGPVARRPHRRAHAAQRGGLRGGGPVSEAPPSVTVLVPVLDEEAAIGECLDRVLAQTHHDLEVVVVDGGSRDGTLELVEARAGVDPRIRVVHTPDRIKSAGLTRALAGIDGAGAVVRL